ncbi:MAG TPA: helix-turn-helix domain-containing protein [Acidimicrobiales bacterium]|nr:helix-turn-helix domain-containing protein [Acidimicrobiales bacterium]
MTAGSDTVERLVELGFSLYDARAYVGLLNQPPMTGYALANTTGIPQPKVYETLRRLARKGVAVALPGEPVRFVAVPPGQVLERLESDFRRRLANAEAGLMHEAGEAGAGVAVFESLRSWPEVERRATALLDGAIRHVYVSINCDAGDVLGAIQRADARGVRSDVLHFGREALELANGRSVRHVTTDGVVYRHHQARHLAVVADGAKVLWSLAPDGSDWEAVVADDGLLAAAVKGYVRHDIYVQQISRDFGELLEARYGPGLGDLVVPNAPAAPSKRSKRDSATA